MTEIAARRAEPDPDPIPRPLGGRYPAIVHLSELHLNRVESASARRLRWVFPRHRYWISQHRLLRNLYLQARPQLPVIVVMMPVLVDSLAKVKPTPREKASTKAKEKASERVSGLDIVIAVQEMTIAILVEMGIAIAVPADLVVIAKGRTAGIADFDRTSATLSAH